MKANGFLRRATSNNIEEERQMVTTWEAIFPTPILRTNIAREFTEKERIFFEQTQNNVCANVLNTRSVDTYVLDALELRSIRSFIAEYVKQFAKKIISVNEQLEFYITQSWINYTKPGQSHHRHFHTNSLVSGVLYISAIKEIDRIYFYRAPSAGISVGDKEQNWYTADSWFFSVGAGDLILFPSNLTHGVEEATGGHTRVSLSFNTFVRGEIGVKEHLSGLTLGIS